MCFLPIYSGRQIRCWWMYQPGSHRRKVTHDFLSTFLLRCMPLFFSREGFSRSFPPSTVKSNLVYLRINRSPLVCVCIVIPFILDVKLVDVPAGVTQAEGHTGFLHLPSAVLTLIFLARRVQPFLSLVDRDVDAVY